jgi:3-oxoacyl-[acyl-carrier-protein] synthase-1
VRVESDIWVTAVGSVSPVGSTFVQTAAAIRAGIARLEESEEFAAMDANGAAVAVVSGEVRHAAAGQRGFLRILRLANAAMEDLLGSGTVPMTELSRATWYLALAEFERPGTDNRAAQTLGRRLADKHGIAAVASAEAYQHGHTGGFLAIQDAVGRLAGGASRTCVIGGVDSYLDEITLAWLHRIERRLKCGSVASGLVPGEAAAFVVLETAEAASERGARPLARLLAIANTEQEETVYGDVPNRGDALGQALSDVLTSTEGEATVDLVVCDLNGERYRAMDWGLASTRAFRQAATDAAIWHPGDCIGDVGAAASVLNVGLAARALERSYGSRGSVLVWGASDYGDRGAACLAAVGSA